MDYQKKKQIAHLSWSPR